MYKYPNDRRERSSLVPQVLLPTSFTSYTATPRTQPLGILPERTTTPAQMLCQKTRSSPCIDAHLDMMSGQVGPIRQAASCSSALMHMDDGPTRKCVRLCRTSVADCTPRLGQPLKQNALTRNRPCSSRHYGTRGNTYKNLRLVQLDSCSHGPRGKLQGQASRPQGGHYWGQQGVRLSLSFLEQRITG